MEMKRPLVTLTLLAAVAISSVALLLTRPSRASYKGHSSARWVAKLGSSDLVERYRAAAAIHAMGTNALPTVVRLFGRKNSSLKLRCNRLSQRFPAFHIHFATEGEWRWAMWLILDSNPQARGATVLALAQLARNPDADVRSAALELLCLSQAIYTEPDALRALQAAQFDSDLTVRHAAQMWMAAYTNWSNIMHEVLVPTLGWTQPAEGGITSLFEGGDIFPSAAEP